MLYGSESREEVGIPHGDDALVANPYLIYECTRLLPGGLAVAASVIDRGVWPLQKIGIALPSNDIKDFEKDGWTILTLENLDAAAIEPLFNPKA